MPLGALARPPVPKPVRHQIAADFAALVTLMGRSAGDDVASRVSVSGRSFGRRRRVGGLPFTWAIAFPHIRKVYKEQFQVVENWELEMGSALPISGARNVASSVRWGWHASCFTSLRRSGNRVARTERFVLGPRPGPLRKEGLGSRAPRRSLTFP